MRKNRYMLIAVVVSIAGWIGCCPGEIFAETAVEFPAQIVRCSAGTEFSLYIDHSGSTSEENLTENSQVDGKLPKTGDSGIRKEVFLIAALIFGAGYLACDHYEKKTV